MKNKIPSNNIGLIGGYGFIGQHLLQEIKKLKIYKKVFVIGNKMAECFELKGSSYKQNIIKSGEINQIISQLEIIVYLAWNSTPFSSLKSDKESNNITVLSSYLNEISQNTLQKIIFLSSAGALYKSENKLEFTECSSFLLESNYAKEKIDAENLIARTMDSSDKIIIMRPSNIYGPGQNFKLGMGLIPKLFDCAIKENAILLYEPLMSERDYLFVDDFVDVMKIFIASPKLSGIYNISSEDNTSLSSLISNIEVIMKGNIKKERKLINKANRAMIISKKAKNDTKWEAKTSLNDGLVQTWNYYK